MDSFHHGEGLKHALVAVGKVDDHYHICPPIDSVSIECIGQRPSWKNHEILFTSGNPKISRIGRQKRKNNFFLFSPKEPIWLTIFENDIKRFDFLFLYPKFAKPENSATGPLTAAMRLEIWHMFNTLVRTHQTSS